MPRTQLRRGYRVIRRLSVAGALLVTLLLVGALGYMLVEGWSFLDSLFMTVITVATVGFREIHPLSPAGQIYTMALIMVGVGALGFTLGVFVDFLGEGRIRKAWEDGRMRRTIDGLSGHYIVVGMGRVGSVVATSLDDDRVRLVVMDNSEEVLEDARERGWLVVFGDATQEAVLKSAGVQSAAGLITTLPSDGGNMFVTVTAKTLNPEIFIVSRSEHEASESFLLHAGADRVLTPDVIGGRRMATLARNPLVSDYFDLVTQGRDVQFRLQDVQLPADSPLAGKTIREEAVRDRYGTYILAIQHPDGTVDTNPSMDAVMLPGSVLVVLGTPEQIEALTQGV